MIRKSKFETNNIFYKENGHQDFKKSSHYLTKNKKQEMTRFVTFDTESAVEFYNNDKKISRNEYNKLKSYSLTKYEKFNLISIQACFCSIRATKRIIYLYNKSFNLDKIKFNYTNKITNKFNMINATIKL